MPSLKQCSWEIWRERGLANKFHNQFNSAIETMVVANNLFNWSLASSRLSSPSPRINRRAPYEDDSATYKVQLWKPSYNDQNQNDPPHQHWRVHVAFPLKLFHIEAENSFVSLRKSQSYSITITIVYYLSACSKSSPPPSLLAKWPCSRHRTPIAES